jgi:hypothetical protein
MKISLYNSRSRITIIYNEADIKMQEVLDYQLPEMIRNIAVYR